MTRMLLAGALLVLLGASASQAQSLEALRGGSGAYYTFADPTDITIRVKVWGAVGNPGLYEVRQGMHLSTLLTLAGGPATGVQSAGTNRTLIMRLHRPQPDGLLRPILETRMENEILVLDEDPVLLNGDILVVEEHVKQRFSWRDALSIVTVLGTVTLIVERLAN